MRLNGNKGLMKSFQRSTANVRGISETSAHWPAVLTAGLSAIFSKEAIVSLIFPETCAVQGTARQTGRIKKLLQMFAGAL
jgi:hypothetical protein